MSGRVASYSRPARSPRRISISETIPLAAEAVGGHPRGGAAGGVDECEAALVHALRPGPVHQAHPLDHGAAGAAQIHGLPAGPGLRRAFRDRDCEASLA